MKEILSWLDESEERLREIVQERCKEQGHYWKGNLCKHCGKPHLCKYCGKSLGEALMKEALEKDQHQTR